MNENKNLENKITLLNKILDEERNVEDKLLFSLNKIKENEKRNVILS